MHNKWSDVYGLMHMLKNGPIARLEDILRVFGPLYDGRSPTILAKRRLTSLLHTCLAAVATKHPSSTRTCDALVMFSPYAPEPGVMSRYTCGEDQDEDDYVDDTESMDKTLERFRTAVADCREEPKPEWAKLPTHVLHANLLSNTDVVSVRMFCQALAEWQMTDLRDAARGDDGDAGRHPDGEGGDDNPGNNLGDGPDGQV